MTTPEIPPETRYSYLSTIIDVLEQTVARVRLSNDAERDIMAMQISPVFTIGGVALLDDRNIIASRIDMHAGVSAVAEDTMRTASQTIHDLGGMPVAYDDEATDSHVRTTVFGLFGYDSVNDIWTLNTEKDPAPTPLSMFSVPPHIQRTTEQLRTAFECAYRLANDSSAVATDTPADTMES